MVLGGLGTLKEKPKSQEDLLTPETAQNKNSGYWGSMKGS